MNNVRTVSDTKRAFHTAHTRPINSVYRRVVEELMVEMHLLTVGSNFSYTSIYALGVVTTFDRFMAGYEPESDRTSIFSAICSSAGQKDASQFRKDSTALLEAAKGLSADDVVAILKGEGGSGGSADAIKAAVQPLMDSATKYSRLLGVGLFTILEACDLELIKDKEQLTEFLTAICEPLNLPADKLDKDLELYRGNLEKLAMAQETMKDILEAERKQREQRAKAKEESGKEVDSEKGEEAEAAATGSTAADQKASD
ncbi:MAG: photosystem II biogenesis protein Psp29 [Cyanobacteria bacterium P01_D01_bin.73]